MSQKHTGVLLSYLNLAVGILVNLFLTPMMIDILGDGDYSLYKVMQAFAGPLAMFHFGIATIAARSVVREKEDAGYTRKDKENTLAMAFGASFLLSAAVAAAAGVMYALIPGIYGNAYDPWGISLGKQVFLLFAGATILHMLTDTFAGCMTGHEHHAVSSGFQLGKSILRMFLLYLLLKGGAGIFWIAAVDFLLAAILFLSSAGYTAIVLGEQPKLTRFDWRELWDILSFGAAILLQAVVNQVNNNVDTMLLGAYVQDKSIITMYASALAIYGMYNSLTSVLCRFCLPTASRLVLRRASGAELTDFVIRPGRVQAVIAVGCVCGFALLGRNFITLWIGDNYLDAYWVCLMLMVPVTIPLVENTAISILDASMKRIWRSSILCAMALLNVLLSLSLMRLWGFWGAALGTVISLVAGHGVLMNLYYAKTFHMEIGRMFRSIFNGILPAGLLASAICFPLNRFPACDLPGFLLKCTGFLAVYGVLLWAFGLNEEEKAMVRKLYRQTAAITHNPGE